MYTLRDEYLVWLSAQNYSADTVRTGEACVGYFVEWCRERSIEDVTEVTRPVLEFYPRGKIFRVDGSRRPDEVTGEMLRVLKFVKR